MKDIWTIYKRELSSYFSQPVAYAIIVVFLIFSLGFTFSFGNFFRIGDASLGYSFFFWHPWILMFLAPAVGMRSWADEQRNGTIELLGTFPLSTWGAIFGKFFASASVWFVALLLTFPIVITVNWLGKPDNGIIIASYIGSFLTCCTFLALTMLISACTRDQVVCLIVSVLLCSIMVLIGFDDVTSMVFKISGRTAVDVMTSVGVLDHFNSLSNGALRFSDLIWFISIIGASLLGTSAILQAKRA